MPLCSHALCLARRCVAWNSRQEDTNALQSEAKIKLKEDLAGPLRIMQENARRIAKVSNESKIALVEDEYVQSFKVEMMDAVLQWCKGAKFADICKVCKGAHSATVADVLS